MLRLDAFSGHDLPTHEADAVRALAERARLHDGHPALNDHLAVDLDAGGQPRFAAVVGHAAHDAATTASGAASRAASGAEPGAVEPGAVVAYAQASWLHDGWVAGVVVDPSWRGTAAADEVLSRLLDEVGAQGGGRVTWWVTSPCGDDTALARRLGLEPGRELLQMRRSLPAGAAPGIATRAFVVGQDEDAWLAVNNRAFAWHDEQGGWDVDTLRRREAEPWFEPEGFLLHERDGHLAGFCWTKVHRDEDPPVGEIYVIAVDPDHHGLGLGRALTLAGLENMAARGITVGMLFVDADNSAAVGLYEALGFTVHRRDHAFVTHVTARPAATSTS